MDMVKAVPAKVLAMGGALQNISIVDVMEKSLWVLGMG